MLVSNLQLQNSKAKVRIIHQQIHWLLMSDKVDYGHLEYFESWQKLIKNVHSSKALG